MAVEAASHSDSTASEHELTLNSVAPDGAAVELRVSFPAPGIARLVIGDDSDVSALPCLNLPSRFAPGRKLDDNTVAGGGLVVHLAPDSFNLSVTNESGRKLLRSSVQDLTQKGAIRVASVEILPKAIATSLQVEPDDHFLGYGEKFCAFDKRGLTIISDNSNAGGATSEQAYKNVPFFVNTRGYGVLFNTTRKIRHDVAEPRLSILSYRIEVDSSALDMFVIDGPDPKTILKRYADLTGYAPVAPFWSYGVWMSRFYFETWDTLDRAANGYREHDIPCDVVAPDSYWLYGDRLADLQWDETRFPDAKAHLTSLRERGFRTCLWIYPYLSEKSPLFQDAFDKGYLCKWPDGSPAIIPTTLPMPCHDVPGFRGVGTLKHVFKHPIAPPGALIDFTNPEAVEWYRGLLKARLEEGVAVFKTDFGEDVPDDVQFFDGRVGRDLHNIYPLLFQDVVAKATAEHTGDWIVWARAGWAGSQAHPVHWGGDSTTSFQAMSASLRGGLSYGLCGVPYWSHDMGGFAGPAPSPELYTRWAQFGLLSSHSRFHGTTPREPWEFGAEATEVTRNFAKMRARLLPYLYHLGVVASQTGLPVMRALMLEFPGDPGARLIDQQFLLGDQLLVCPVFNETGDVEYYLPSGARWLDLRSGVWLDGGQWRVETGLPLSNMPVFLRQDAVVPIVPVAPSTNETDFSQMSLLVAADAIAERSFHLPNGIELEAAFAINDGKWQGRARGLDRPLTISVVGGTRTGTATVSGTEWTNLSVTPEPINLHAYKLR